MNRRFPDYYGYVWLIGIVLVLIFAVASCLGIAPTTVMQAGGRG